MARLTSTIAACAALFTLCAPQSAIGQDTTLEELERAASATFERIERLKDKRDIERVQRAYGYYVDKAIWRPLSELFTEDATLEIGGRGVFDGRERIYEYMSVGLGSGGPREGIVMDHQQLAGIVTISPGGEHARGRWRAFVQGVGRGDGVIGVVTYENEYRKIDGVWHISVLRAPFDMYTPYQKGWGEAAVPNTTPSTFPPLPDHPPSVDYESYPALYLEPYHYPNPVTGRGGLEAKGE